MTIAPSRRMTLDEFLALPEEKPYLEYIRGEILPKPVPTRPHGRLVSRLLLRLGSYLEESEEAIVET